MECREALSERRLWPAPVGLIGLVAAIGGVIVRKPTNTNDNT